MASYCKVFVVSSLLAVLGLIWETDVSAGEITVRFYGSSSFLIEDDTTQILIDGFFTRTSHRFIRKISPDLEQLRETVQQTGICIYPLRSRTQEQNCRAGKSLDIIVPVHGHYDHALDSGVLALWAGSRLVADDSIEAVLEASKHLTGSLLGLEEWREPTIMRPFKDESSQRSEPISVGRFTVTLIRTAHLSSLPTFFIRGTTKPEIKFPAGIGEFRLGTSFSVHIEHGEQSLLIVPSAGNIEEAFSNKPSVRADTVFLGVGGLGVRRRSGIEAFWKDTVTTVGADDVYLIHWDSDQVAFDLDQPFFRIARPAIFRRTLRIFDDIKHPDTRLNLPPAITPFQLQ